MPPCRVQVAEDPVVNVVLLPDNLAIPDQGIREQLGITEPARVSAGLRRGLMCGTNADMQPRISQRRPPPRQLGDLGPQLMYRVAWASLNAAAI